MKHVFIVNPAAGNGKIQEALLPRILDAVKKWGADYEIHRTSGPGEATTYTRGKLEAGRGEIDRNEADREEVIHDEADMLEAGQGEAGRGEADREEVKRDEADLIEAGRGEAGRGETDRGEAEQNETEQVEVGQVETDRGVTGQGEKIRFYVCGGDGTAAEVLNGLYGFPEAELAIIPAGSGNDYVRNFDDREKFLDITAQLAGEAVPVDVIRYSYTPASPKSDKEGEPETLYALNMVNMGFDAKAAAHMTRFKNKLFLRGTGAYIAGVLKELTSYKMSHAAFRPEGEDAFEADFLLGGVGSGRFSGGGFDGIPHAVVHDGLLDLIIVDPLSRGEFLKLVGIYHDGKHTEHPELMDRMRLMSVKGVEIEPASGLVFTTDGEAHYTKSTLSVSLAPEKIRFVVPDGVARP